MTIKNQIFEKEIVKKKQYMTVKDCAAYLQVSLGYIYERIYKKEIPSVRLGRSVRIKSEDFEKWLTSLGGGY